MELQAVLGRVVKPPAPLEGVVAVVPETGIAGDLGAQCHHPVEEIFQCVLVPQPPGGEEFPDLLAQAAVGLFQKLGGLLQGHLLATIDDRHRAGELLVVLHQQRVLCLQGNVLLTEQRYVVLHDAVQDAVPVRGQASPVRVFQIGEFQRVPVRLGLGVDLLDELLIGRLPHWIVCLHGHRNVSPRALFGDGGGQFGAVHQPPFQLVRGVDGPVPQPCEQRFDLRPLAHGRACGDEPARKRTARVNLHQFVHGITPLTTAPARCPSGESRCPPR